MKELIEWFGGKVEFATPVVAKATPHTPPVKVWRVELTDGVPTYNGGQAITAEMVENSIKQRLKWMKHEKLRQQ